MELEQRAVAAEAAAAESDRQLEEARQKLDEASKRPKPKEQRREAELERAATELQCQKVRAHARTHTRKYAQVRAGTRRHLRCARTRMHVCTG